MQITTSYLVLDAADSRAEADFWAALLGGETQSDGDRWIEVTVEGRTALAIQHAPDHIHPTWPLTDPSEQHSMQMHLDLYVPRPEVEDACAEAISAGASLVQEAENPQADGGFVVLSDPAGHPFCICWNEAAR